MMAINHQQNTLKRLLEGGDKKNRKGERTEKIKARTRCVDCGKLGCWFKDSPECLQRMKENWLTNNGIKIIKNQNQINMRNGFLGRGISRSC